MLETPVQQRARVVGSQVGLLVMRNNVGACYDNTQRLIRYGLMNESAELNARYKSSDLINITPVRITAEMVGKTVGIFTAFETKKTGWYLTQGDAHGQAQDAFHILVRSYGGIAGFITDAADILPALHNGIAGLK